MPEWLEAIMVCLTIVFAALFGSASGQLYVINELVREELIPLLPFRNSSDSKEVEAAAANAADGATKSAGLYLTLGLIFGIISIVGAVI